MSRETDKLLLGIFTQLFFWNTQLFFQQGVSKSKGIIDYPIKIVEFMVHRKDRRNVWLPI